MTRHLLFAAAAVLLSSASASADRVYLKSSSAPPTGSRPAAGDELLHSIEGAVTAETKDSVTIRVEGGEVTIARDRVARIEQGGLTLEDVRKRESDLASREVPADQARRTAHAQWVDATAKRQEEERTESDAGRDRPLEIVVDFKGLLPAQVLRFYDPVLHVVRTVPVLERIDMDGLARAVEAYLIDELRRLELR